MNCLHCRATVTNGLALCELCQRKVTLVLEFVPVYFRNLARWKPGRAGSREVPGSRVLYDGAGRSDGTGDRISDRLDEAATALITWARALAEDRPGFARPLTLADAVLLGDLPDELADDKAWVIGWLCWVFEERLTTIATLEWCGEFVRDIGKHEAVLRTLTEQVAPGWYAGACRRCKHPTHVIPGLTWVRCDGCGATTYARDHLGTVLDEARGWVAPPRRIAEAVVALVDTEVSVPRLHDRIRQWASRERLTPIRRIERKHVYDLAADTVLVRDVETGHARYRLGEVLDRIAAEGATRVDRPVTDVANGA